MASLLRRSLEGGSDLEGQVLEMGPSSSSGRWSSRRSAARNTQAGASHRGGSRRVQLKAPQSSGPRKSPPAQAHKESRSLACDTPRIC